MSRTRATDRRETTDRRKVAAMQTDHKANSPPLQRTAKARGSKKHFASYRFATIVYLMSELI